MNNLLSRLFGPRSGEPSWTKTLEESEFAQMERDLLGHIQLDTGKQIETNQSLDERGSGSVDESSVRVIKTTSRPIPEQESSIIHPRTGLELVFIPAGDFLMGDCDLSRNPRHTVTLNDYWISRTVVSVEQYLMFCSETGARIPDAPDFNPNWSKHDHPIVNVSWYEAQEYCSWAGLLLPSEAQWEKAARGTDGRKYPWGDNFDPSKLQCSKSSYGDAGSTAHVTQFRQGPYDLCDVAGNVLQWCRDSYDGDFWSNRPIGETDPVNLAANSRQRVLRGGAWFIHYPINFRAAYRGNSTPSDKYYNYGFRVSSGP